MRIPFTIPSKPTPPPAVRQAQAKLEKLYERSLALDEQIREAEQAVTEARRNDVRAVADAAHRGEVVDDPRQYERAALAEVEKAKAPREGLNLALAEQTGELLDALKAHVEKWLDATDDLGEKGLAKLQAGADQAHEGAREVAAARGTRRFLQQFLPDFLENAPPAVQREWPESFAGSDRLDLPDLKFNANTQRNVFELLAAVRSLTALPPKPPEPRSLQVKASHPGDGSVRIADPQTAGFAHARR